MQEHESTQSEQPTPVRAGRSLPFGAIAAGLAALGILAGGGAAWWTWNSIQSDPVSPISSQLPTETSPAPSTSEEQTVQVYWLKTVNNEIEPVASPVTIAATDRPDVVLQAAFEKMLAGSDSPDLTSTIPEGTQLRAVDVKEDGVYVDLSKEFTSGGGSASMMGRLAQVIYTATTLNPEAQVWISVEGKPLEVLGGEGLLVDQPMTRDSFEQNFPL